MRIGVIAGPHVTVPPAKYGGTEQIIYYLIRGLQEEGHEIILFGAGDSTVDCELVPIVDKAILFPKKKAELEAHQAQLNKISAYTEQKVREYLPKLDIIHSHGFDLFHFQDFPNITTLHGIIDFKELPYYLARKNLFYVSISSNQQDTCPELQYAGVVYNGEDPAKFPLVKEPEDYLCFLGRFDHDKNPHLAIQLAINLGMPIKVAGKMDFLGEDYFEQEIRPYLDHPLVEFLGELDFKAKIELLSKARCNLHPTGFREPFGLTVLEAAYCGTPTLATARGSMPELIEVDRTGMLVEDFIEGYHQIQNCFEMNREYIAQRARMLFNYQTMTKGYIDAYKKVLDAFTVKQSRADVLRSLTTVEQALPLPIWQGGQEQLSKGEL